MINTSEVRINVATDAAHGLDGLRALKRAFDIAAPDEAPAVAGV
jgi:hypothetical protein